MLSGKPRLTCLPRVANFVLIAPQLDGGSGALGLARPDREHAYCCGRLGVAELSEAHALLSGTLQRHQVTPFLQVTGEVIAGGTRILWQAPSGLRDLLVRASDQDIHRLSEHLAGAHGLIAVSMRREFVSKSLATLRRLAALALERREEIFVLTQSRVSR